MQSKRVLILVSMILGLCSCTATLTLGTAPVRPAEVGSQGLPTGSEDVPTPQLVRVGVGLERGDTVVVRLLEDPAWKAPQDEQLRLKAARAQSSAKTSGPQKQAEHTSAPDPSIPGVVVATGPTVSSSPM